MTARSTTPQFVPGELREWRRRMGLTQRDLAAALGVTDTTVARWERGERSIANPVLVRLALDHLETCPVAPAVARIPAAELD